MRQHNTPSIYRFSLTRCVALIALASVLVSCDSGVIVGGSLKQIDTTEFDLGITDACFDSQRGLTVCPASDMTRITRTGSVPYEHSDYDWSRGPLQVRAARNETVAFQLLLRTSGKITTDDVSIALDGFVLNGGGQAAVKTAFDQTLFSAFYHPIDNAGYDWGPKTPVLPWPDEYPDALVPALNSCAPATSLSASNTETTIDVDVVPGTNQSIWVDTYVDRNTAPGVYSQNIKLRMGGEIFLLPVELTVYSATIPDETSIDAVGELYRTYGQEGVGFDITQPQWRAMAQCYQRLAHQHRMVFIERLPDLLTRDEIENYADTLSPYFTGELFSKANGYVGPGSNTPVALWKTPWPQTINGVNYNGISDREIERFKGLATIWDEVVTRRGWAGVDYFAYVFDEVDGPKFEGDGTVSRDEYLAFVHNQMDRVQTQIDSGSGDTKIDLIWTSHSNPATWRDDPDIDLTDIIRLWAPNAAAADTEFLKQRRAAGEKTWFYHNGHPAVGAHSINVSGIEMRTWGVIGARYEFDGQLMWAVNLGSKDFPYRDPQYKVDETRAGNGVMVYPGNELDKIGYQKSPGPVPSMRLKSWRRGLQDAELYYLALKTNPSETRQLMLQQMPRALTEGKGLASWSSSTANWIAFHRRLLELASSR